MKGSFPDGRIDKAPLRGRWLTEKEAVPRAGVTLVLGGPRAAEALGVAGLASQHLRIPVLREGTFLVRHADPVAVQPLAFQTGGTGPRRWAGLAGPGAICGWAGAAESESGPERPTRESVLQESVVTCLPCFFQRFLELSASSVEPWVGYSSWALGQASLLQNG